MSPLLLLAIGMAIVVAGILVFRLHAFLALILAALVVAGLTTDKQVHDHLVWTEGIPIVATDGEDYLLKKGRKQEIFSGRVLIWRGDEAVGEADLRFSDAKVFGDSTLTPVRLELEEGDARAGDRIVHH
ncbi:MAG: hypothetical protein AAF492_14015, partial [Verrucomicrobiota bacterium]